MIFKEYLSDLHIAIREEQSSDYGDGTVDSLHLLSCWNVLDVGKDFLNHIIPLLRKSLELVTTWKFWGSYISWDKPENPSRDGTWQNAALHFAALKRIVASSTRHGFRFDRFTLHLVADDPGGYEIAGFLAARAKQMRARGVIGGHDFDGRFKSWWIDWRGRSERDREHFDYERGRSDDDPVFFSMEYWGTGDHDDYVDMWLESDAVTLDFQDFDWKSTTMVEYVY